MKDIEKDLDAAMALLVSLFMETKSSEIGDALDMLSAYRDQYIEDNSQFGVGA